MTYPLALHHQYGTLLLLSDSISRSIFQFLKMIFHSVCRIPASHLLQLLQQFCSMDVFQLLFMYKRKIFDEKLQFIATYLVIIMHVIRAALTSEKCWQIKSIFSHKLIKIAQRLFVINAMPCMSIMVKNMWTFLSFSSVHVQWKFRTATFAHSNKFFMLSRIFLMTFSHLDGMQCKPLWRFLK